MRPGRTRPSPSSPSPSRSPTAADVYAAVAPSVVTIQAAQAGGTADEGTGIVVNASGAIITALHVVRAATAIQVTFADGTASPATVAATAPALDIAALVPDELP